MITSYLTLARSGTYVQYIQGTHSSSDANLSERKTTCHRELEVFAFKRLQSSF